MFYTVISIPARGRTAKYAAGCGLPCFGEEKQYFTLTDKRTFKKLCRENGVDTIPEYPIDIFTADGQDSAVEYPVFVKPGR